MSGSEGLHFLKRVEKLWKRAFPLVPLSTHTTASLLPPGPQSQALPENSGQPLSQGGRRSRGPKSQAGKSQAGFKANGESRSETELNKIQTQFLRKSPRAPNCESAGRPSKCQFVTPLGVQHICQKAAPGPGTWDGGCD